MITYRGCFRWSLIVVAAVAGLLTGGGIAQVITWTGVAAATMAVLWLAFTLRVIRLAPACPAPGGGPGPGGAGVREPRRPMPHPPGGSIALPLPKDPPDSAAALA